MNIHHDGTVFYYGPGTCALAGIITLEWSGMPYRLGRVTGDILWSNAYKQINPLSKVPALHTSDGILLENAAILVRIADRGSTTRLAPEPATAARDQLNQWLSFLASEFHPAFWPIYMPNRYTINEADYDNVKAAAVNMVRSKYARLDAHLADNSWILGDMRSIADAFLFAMARWGEKLMDVAADFPNVHRHLTQMRDDSAVQFGLAVEAGEVVKAEDGGGDGFQGHVELV